MDGFWGAPGGHLDVDETFTQAAIREVKEEIGIKLDPKNFSQPLFLYNIDPTNQKVFLGNYSLCEFRDGKPTNNEPDHCSKLSWYDIHQLPKTTAPFARQALQWLLDWLAYIEVQSQENSNIFQNKKNRD